MLLTYVNNVNYVNNTLVLINCGTLEFGIRTIAPRKIAPG